MPIVASVLIGPESVVRATNTGAFDPRVSHINTCLKSQTRKLGLRKNGGRRGCVCRSFRCGDGGGGGGRV